MILSAVLAYSFFAFGTPGDMLHIAEMSLECGYQNIHVEFEPQGPVLVSRVLIDHEDFWAPHNDQIRNCLFEKIEGHLFSVEFFVERSLPTPD